MKTTKILAMAAMLTIATSASAQFATNNRTSSVSTVSTDGWSSVWVEYSPTKLKVDNDDVEDFSGTALSFGYSKTFGLSDNLPLLVEAGLGLQYTFFSETNEYEDYGIKTTYKQDINIFSAKIPVNLMYAAQFPNTSITLMPYIGVTARYNFSGKLKEDITQDVEFEAHDESFDINLFDKKDMDGSKNTWKRFQLGWQLGVKARFAEKFLVGVSYGSDFSEIGPDIKLSTASISVGYTF